MELLLMGGALSMLGLAVVSLAFGAATGSESPEPSLAKQPAAPQPQPSRFFAPPRPKQPALVPIEALLLQIESHVRLEQAAAESFVEYPTAALLHSRTISPLIQ